MNTVNSLDQPGYSNNDLWYFVCTSCDTKFFYRKKRARCPRCAERLESSERRERPWRRPIERIPGSSWRGTVEVLRRQIAELQGRVGQFLVDCEDPMDRPTSWCNIGTFIWNLGEDRALLSLSFSEMLTGQPDKWPPVREWLRKVSRDDRRRFFWDLRKRFITRKAIVDGLYWVQLAKGPRLCLLRTVLVDDPQLALLGTVVEMGDANGIEPLFTPPRTRLAPATFWSRVLAATVGKVRCRLGFH
jgi:hypothetical protein